MKRFFSALAVLILTAVSLYIPCGAVYNSELETIYSPIYLLLSLDNGTVIFSNGADEKTAPASFVKIVSAIAVIENCSNVDEAVTVTQEALDVVKYSGGATSELKAGEVLTVKQLLYCSMLQSANDATNVLALHIGKNMQNFVTMLNDCVKKIGCENTVLVNATGIDEEGQYTTAEDIAKIIEYGLDLPVFSEIFCAKQIEIPATELHKAREYYSGNKMMFSSRPRYYYEYVTGGKSGSTDNAGNVFAACAVKDGYSYLAIVMKGETKVVSNTDDEKFNCAILDAKSMLKWTYGNIRLRTVVSASQVISVVDVVAGKQTDCIRLVPASDVSALVPANTDAGAVLVDVDKESLPKKIVAPVKKGEVYGSAKVIFAGEEIAKVDLVAGENVVRSTPRYIVLVTKRVVSSPVFIVIAAAIVAAFAIYLVFVINVNRKEKRSRLQIVGKK